MGNVLPSEGTREPLTDHQGKTTFMNFSQKGKKRGTMGQKGIGVMGVTKVGHRKPRDEQAKHGMFMARGGAGRPRACSI